MGPFPHFFGHQYVLIDVSYVSKWAKIIPYRTNDHKIVMGNLKKNIISWFRLPQAIISDDCTKFCNRSFKTLLTKYSITYKVATLFCPQISGKVKILIQEIKILEKMVRLGRKN